MKWARSLEFFFIINGLGVKELFISEEGLILEIVLNDVVTYGHLSISRSKPTSAFSSMLFHFMKKVQFQRLY